MESDEISGKLREADHSELAAKIRKIMGASYDEVVEVHAPPHKSRLDGKNAAYIETSEFEKLRSMTKEQLIELGMRAWSEESRLLLFPYEWYELIPDGFEVVDIFGETETFKRGETDDDCRFGVLAFGIIPNSEKDG